MATKTITAEKHFYSVRLGWRDGECRQGYHTEIGLIVGYLRFPNVSIPSGATINSATLSVTLGDSGLGSWANKTLDLYGYWNWDGKNIDSNDFAHKQTATVKNGNTYDIDVTDIIKNSGQQDKEDKEDIDIYCFRNEGKHSSYDYSYNYLSISSATLKIDYTDWTPVGKPGKPEASPISYNHKRTNAGTWYFKGADPSSEAEGITWKWTAAEGGTNNNVAKYRYAIYHNGKTLGSIETKDANQIEVTHPWTKVNRGDYFFFSVRAIGKQGDESDAIDSDYYYVNYAPSISSVSYPATMDLSQGTYSVNFYTLDQGGTLHGQVSTTGPMRTENSVQIGEQTKTNIGAGDQTAVFDDTSKFHEYAGSSCSMYVTANDGMVKTTTKEYTIKVGKSLNFELGWDNNQYLIMKNIKIDGKVDHTNKTTGVLSIYDFQSKKYCSLGITGRSWSIPQIIQACMNKSYPLVKGRFLNNEGKANISCQGTSSGTQGLTNTATISFVIDNTNINNDGVNITIDVGYREGGTHPELVNGLTITVNYKLSNNLGSTGTLYFNYKFSYMKSEALTSKVYCREAEGNGDLYTTTFTAAEINEAVEGYEFSIDVQPVFEINKNATAIGEYVRGVFVQGGEEISTFWPYIPSSISLSLGTEIDGLDTEALAPSEVTDQITLPLIMKGDKATRYYQINKAVISYNGGSVDVSLGYIVNTLIVDSDQSIYPGKNAKLEVAANIESGVENSVKNAKITEVTIIPVNLGNVLERKSEEAEIMLKLDANENITCKLTWQEMLKTTKDGEFDQLLSEQTSQLEVPINTFSKPYFKNNTTLIINFIGGEQ